MSCYTFIASNSQLEDVENTHIKRYSVNEALAKGISVPELVLNSENIDRNKPNVLFWPYDEESFREISITAYSKTTFENQFTNLKYCSHLIWGYSESRAKQLIQYIQKHLEIADNIEIWNVWNGTVRHEPTEKICHIQIESLLPVAFEKMMEYDFYCIVVTRS